MATTASSAATMTVPPAFLRTHTSEQQHELEVKVSELFSDLQDFDEADREEMLLLLRDRHTRYLQVGGVEFGSVRHLVSGGGGATKRTGAQSRPAHAPGC